MYMHMYVYVYKRRLSQFAGDKSCDSRLMTSHQRVGKATVKFYSAAKPSSFILLSLGQGTWTEVLISHLQQVLQFTRQWCQSLQEYIFHRYRKTIRCTDLNLRKPKTWCFPFVKYVITEKIVDESGPFEPGVVSPETQNFYIICKTLSCCFYVHSPLTFRYMWSIFPCVGQV